MRNILSILLILAIISVAPSAYAQDAGSKLLRGIVNTTTGVLELPITVYRISKTDGYPTALTYGMAKGLVNAVLRTAVGVYEVVTFPVPMPEGYESIMVPDTLLTSETLESGDISLVPDFRLLSAELERPSAEK